MLLLASNQSSHLWLACLNAAIGQQPKLTPLAGMPAKQPKLTPLAGMPNAASQQPKLTPLAGMPKSHLWLACLMLLGQQPKLTPLAGMPAKQPKLTPLAGMLNAARPATKAHTSGWHA